MGFGPFTLEDYEITKDGRVINKHNNHVLKPQPNSKGYLRVNLGKHFYFVHRLVAEKYIPNPENKEQVNHIDGNKNNNSVENLEWVSNQENRNHAVKTGLHLQGEKCPWAKLTEKDVLEIRSKYPKISAKELANTYGVSQGTIWSIATYHSWKSVK